jgi:hypothetical protein
MGPLNKGLEVKFEFFEAQADRAIKGIIYYAQLEKRLNILLLICKRAITETIFLALELEYPSSHQSPIRCPRSLGEVKKRERRTCSS